MNEFRKKMPTRSSRKRISKSDGISEKIDGERGGFTKQFSGKKRISKSDEMAERIRVPQSDDQPSFTPSTPSSSGGGFRLPSLGCGSGCCALPFLLMVAGFVSSLVMLF